MVVLSPAEALVGVAWCAAYADGSMGAEEDEELSAELREVHALRALDERQIREALVKVDAFAERNGEAALLAAAGSVLPEELRATAFCLGARLALVDGDYASEERKFLEKLRRALGVPEDVASRIVEVVEILDRA